MREDLELACSECKRPVDKEGEQCPVRSCGAILCSVCCGENFSEHNDARHGQQQLDEIEEQMSKHFGMRRRR